MDPLVDERVIGGGFYLFGFILMGLVLVWILRNYWLFDLTPVARSAILETLDLDPAGRRARCKELLAELRGLARAEDEGLRIFTGPTRRGDVVAAAWWPRGSARGAMRRD